MTDSIADACKKYKFSEMIANRKTELAEIMRLLLRTYEILYGRGACPPELIKRFFKDLIVLSPQNFHMRFEIPKEIADMVIDRVVEEAYEAAKECIIEKKEAKYIS